MRSNNVHEKKNVKNEMRKKWLLLVSKVDNITIIDADTEWHAVWDQKCSEQPISEWKTRGMAVKIVESGKRTKMKRLKSREKNGKSFIGLFNKAT